MKKTSLIILLTIVLIGLLGSLYLLNAKTSNSAPQRLDLPSDDFSMLCNLLDQKDIKANTSFHLFARLLGLDKHVRPGSYIVEPHMRTLTLVHKLHNGQQDPIRLTIGKFRLPQDLNAYLNRKLMHDDFDIPLDSFHLVLPDTYEFYWTVTPEQFMQRMTREYDAFWQKADLTPSPSPTGEGSGMLMAGEGASLSSGSLRLYYLLPSPIGEGLGVRSEHCTLNTKVAQGQVLPTTHYPLPTFKDVVILASIVEEETNYGPEKPLIASVYLNRLQRGMPLQADPTVKYAVGDFSLRRILNKHLAVDSPFNTYLHTGLPPAPICLPSKATIQAVLDAPHTDYLYFCASDRMDGTHRFAATLAEHNRNAARFHKALDARGVR